MGVRFGRRFHVSIEGGYRVENYNLVWGSNHPSGYSTGDDVKLPDGSGDPKQVSADFSGPEFGARCGFDF